MVTRKTRMLYKVSLGYYCLCQSNYVITSVYCVLQTVNLVLWILPPFNLWQLTALFYTFSHNGRERLSSQYKCRQTHLRSSIHVITYTQQNTLAHSQMGTMMCLLTKTVSLLGLIKIKKIRVSWIVIIYIL